MVDDDQHAAHGDVGLARALRARSPAARAASAPWSFERARRRWWRCPAGNRSRHWRPSACTICSGSQPRKQLHDRRGGRHPPETCSASRLSPSWPGQRQRKSYSGPCGSRPPASSACQTVASGSGPTIGLLVAVVVAAELAQDALDRLPVRGLVSPASANASMSSSVSTACRTSAASTSGGSASAWTVPSPSTHAASVRTSSDAALGPREPLVRRLRRRGRQVQPLGLLGGQRGALARPPPSTWPSPLPSTSDRRTPRRPRPRPARAPARTGRGRRRGSRPSARRASAIRTAASYFNVTESKPPDE